MQVSRSEERADEFSVQPIRRARRKGPDVPRWVVALTILYCALAAGVLLRWTASDWVPRTGDEPHYLVATRSLVERHSVDLEATYEEEFVNPEAFDGIPFGPAEAGPLNTHADLGSDDRLYPIHGLGLSILLVPGWIISGSFGAKLTMVLLSAGIVFVVAWASARLIPQQVVAAATAIAVSVSTPLLVASSQIYPDLLVGTVPLAVFSVVMAGPRVRPAAVDGALAIAIGLLPWLHFKNFPILLLCSSVLVVSLFESGSKKRAAAVVTIVTSFATALVVYNLATFGQISGWATSAGAVGFTGSEVSTTSAMVFLGLHIDRAQGMFVQNPLLVLGCLEVAIRLLRREKWSIAYLVTYLLLVVPNATHPNWYGGYSFLGRFGWSASIFLMLATVQGIARARLVAPRCTYALLAGAIALQVIFLYGYVGPRPAPYNMPMDTPLSEYPSWWGPFGRFFPALYDRSTAVGIAQNWVGFGLLLCAISTAAAWALRTRSDVESRLLKPAPPARGIDL